MRNTLFALGFLVAVGTGTASASPIVTFTGTPTGMTFTVESVVATTDLYAADGTSDTYRITLQLTTSGYVGAGHYLNSLALDVGGTLDAASLVSDPVNTDWILAPINKAVNSSGPCGSPDVDGSVCADETASATNNLLLTTDGTYQWVFDIDLASTGFGDTTELQFGISTLKEQTTGPPTNRVTTYSWMKVDTYGPIVARISLDPNPTTDPDPETPPVPEPASMALLGLGLGLLGLASRRRKIRRS